MRISVVVPVLNEAEALPALVGSLAGRGDVDELVVVDASRDAEVAGFYASDGAALCEGVPRRTFIGALDAGRAVQMNLGARHAVGDVLLFLHADTRLPRRDVRALLAGLSPDVGWGRFDVRLDSDAWWAGVVGAMMNLRSRLTGIATGDQAIFVARGSWERVGGYRPLPLMEDVDICRRLKKLSAPLNLSQRVVTSARRWRRHGVAATVVRMWGLRFCYWLGVAPERLARRYRDAR